MGSRRGPTLDYLEFVTANANCWETLKEVVLKNSTAHVIFAQEVKITQDMLKYAQLWARKNKWKLFVAPCLKGPSQGKSAGVAILVKAHLDAHPDLMDITSIVVPGRVMAVPLRLKAFGVIVLYSIYLETSMKLAEPNLMILDCLAAHINAHGKPYLAAGDWQNHPEAISGALQSRMDHCVVLAPAKPTYIHTLASSIIDFFLADTRLAPAFQQVLTQDASLLSPHLPVGTSMGTKGSTMMVPVVAKPPSLPAAPPYGPIPPQPDWSNICDRASRCAGEVKKGGRCLPASSPIAQECETLLDLWYDKANVELLDVLGRDVSIAKKLGKPLKVSTQSLASLCAHPQPQLILPSRYIQAAATRVMHLAIAVRNCRDRHASLADIPQNGDHNVQLACRRIAKMAKATNVDAQTRAYVLDNPLFAHAVAGGPNLGQFQADLMEWAKRLLKKAAELRGSEASNSRESFKTYANKVLTEDIGAAFRFVKAGNLAEPKPLTLKNGDVTVDDASNLHNMMDALTTAWCVDSMSPLHAVEFGDPGDISLVEPLVPEELYSASRSFKLRTVRADGWHPRHFALICPDGMQCLANILCIVEALGDLPPAYRDLHMPTIGDVKRRVIGCFRSLFRLWGRARRRIIHKWSEDNLNEDFFNNKSGRRIGDSTWRAAVSAREATQCGDINLELLADLRKCFEFVNRGILWGKATALGYPLPILRLSIASYKWKRVVSWDGMASNWIFALCGIVAGGAFATDELKVYMVVDLRRVKTLNPDIPFGVHVDDFLITAVGKNRKELLNNLMKFLAHLFDAMTNVLHLVFAADKIFVLCNTKGIAQTVVDCLGKLGGSVASTVNRLGIPFSAGGKMHSYDQRIRVQKALGRKNRTDMLARAVNTSKGASVLFFGGTLPAANFGAETVGMPKGAIKSLVSAAASSLKMARRLTHSPIAWAVITSKKLRNPEASILAMPVLRYAREWWLATDKDYVTHDTLSPPKLVSAFVSEIKWLCEQHRTHSQMMCSPLAIAIKAADELGMSFNDPVNLTSCVEGDINILQGSPALLENACHDAYHYKKVKDKVKSIAEASCGGCGGELDAILQHGLWLEPIKQLYHSKARYSLNFKQRRCLLKFVSRVYVTSVDFAKWGYACDGCCPFCGSLDTIHHRIYTCPQFAGERAELLSKKLVDDAVKAGDKSLLYTSGWATVPHDIVTVHQPHNFQPLFFLDGLPCEPFEFDIDLPVYGDGSGLRPAQIHVARAGFAIAQFRSDGTIYKLITCTVPGTFPQTAACAERLAVFFANRYMPGVSVEPYVGDCTSALKLLSDPILAKSPAALWAQLAREMQVEDGLKMRHSRWVKSHQTVSDGMKQQLKRDILCNAAVDEHAKAAAAQFKLPDSDVAAYSRYLCTVKRALRAAAVMLALWPSSLDMHGKLERAANMRISTPTYKQPHSFVWNGKGWTCVKCLRRKGTSSSAIDAVGCVSVPDALVELLAEPRGHAILGSATDDGVPLFFCTKCGAYTQGRVGNLAKVCVPRTKKSQSPSLHYLLHHSKHPVHQGPIDRPVPISAFEVNACGGSLQVMPQNFAIGDVQHEGLEDPIGTHQGPICGFDDPDFEFIEEDFDDCPPCIA